VVAFHLQSDTFLEWAMLVSKQRPLSCEGRSLCSQLSASVQKLLQIGKLVGEHTPANLSELPCTGVLLVYQHARELVDQEVEPRLVDHLRTATTRGPQALKGTLPSMRHCHHLNCR
jgi:hypothetical protein